LRCANALRGPTARAGKSGLGVLPALPAEAGNGQRSETETPLVLLSAAFWSEGLSHRSSISAKSTHSADRGNRVDIIHADLRVTLAFGRCDSLRTKSPALCKHRCNARIQRISSRWSLATSLESYLRRLAPRSFRLHRGDDVSTRKKGPRGGRDRSLHAKLQAALVGDVGFQGTHVLAAFLRLPRAQESSSRVFSVPLPQEQANSAKSAGCFWCRFSHL